MTQRILVACIGNIFLGDDGFGVEAASALRSSALGSLAFSEEVKLVDYGIRGLDLAYALLEPWETVILVDVVARGGAPGTLYLLQPSGADLSSNEAGLDPHAMDPVKVLAMARSLGEVRAEIYIVGCEPLDFGDELEGRMGLSPQVEAAIPKAVEMVRELLERLRENAGMIAAV